ncbi:MAG: thiamine pyrophosphate-dependent enzyme [Thermoplasmatota archaeon]
MEGDLGTYAENTWCKGCGNFGLMNAFKKAVKDLEEDGISRESMMISAGIGCHGKIFDYLDLSGLYSIHGREMATVEGMVFANPELNVIAFGGDGDVYGEGISHLIFAAKRNANITLIVHNNSAYALTTGQFSPTSEKGFKGPSSPAGSTEPPLNPLAITLSAGASFVARGYAGKVGHLRDLFVEGVKHQGFSLIDVLQPCVTFNDTYQKYNEAAYILDDTPDDLESAIELTKKEDEIPLGVYYKEEKPVYHEALYGDKNPVKDRMSKEERDEKIIEILKG